MSKLWKNGNYITGIPLTDSNLSSSSENPVQNKVINNAISSLNSSLANYLKTKRVRVDPTPNQYIAPFTHYATIDYSQYGITKDKIVSIMLEGSSAAGGGIAYLGANGASIHVHATTTEARYVTIVYLGN